MPEIGETLREARMRRRIDMTEVESVTKIRAKYLRALENEEWELLPGPTFVKTFLRTYSEYLELDSRLMVEEYKQRFERPSSMDLTPFSNIGVQRRRRRPRPSVGPVVVVVLGVALLLGALALLGTLGGNDDNDGTAAPPRTTPEPSATVAGSGSDEEQAAPSRRPTRVELRIVPTGEVYVCLEDAAGRAVIDKATLQAGERTRSYRSRRFRIAFGRSDARMLVNGRSYPVATSTEPVGYELRPGRRPQRLPAGQLPLCS